MTSLKPGISPGWVICRARWPEYLPFRRSFELSW